MRLHAKYLSYACKHKLFVSLFFVFKNISRSILFQAVQHLNIFIYVLTYAFLHAYFHMF